jgi:hypothetical protein
MRRSVMRASRSRPGLRRCAIVSLLVLAGLACHTTKVVNFPAPAEPCLTEADVELVCGLLPEATCQRAIYSWSYCVEGEEKLQ